MKTPRPTFRGAFAPLSLRATLQAALFTGAEAIVPGKIPSPAQISLKACHTPTGVAYRSGVSLQLQAALAEGSVWPAPRLALAVLQHVVPQTIPYPFAIAQHWQAQTEAGWILISLQDAGVTAWLRHLNSIDVLPQEHAPWPSLPQPLPQVACPENNLNLSLPLWLQFGHSRCAAWLRYADQLNGPSVPTASPPGKSKAQNLIWQWDQQCPAPCHHLLQATVHTLDAMVERPGVRQACTLAHAVQQCQAAIPLGTIPALPAAVQAALWSLMKAAQQVLALVIIGVFRQRPALYI